jgi:hypothetical protein
MSKKKITDKQKVKKLLVSSLHQTIEKLGVDKSGKKTEKLLNKSAKKIAASITKELKKAKKKKKSVASAKAKKIKTSKRIAKNKPKATRPKTKKTKTVVRKRKRTSKRVANYPTVLGAQQAAA